MSRRHTHRFKWGCSGINHRAKRPFNLETTDRGDAEACQALMFQPLPYSHGVLVQGRVCKPFAHECWLIRTERRPMRASIRINRWPTHARVGKPEGSCSQAATAISDVSSFGWPRKPSASSVDIQSRSAMPCSPYSAMYGPKKSRIPSLNYSCV